MDKNRFKKELARSLEGKALLFVDKVTRVTRVCSDGMVEIEGFVGQFAPHVFVVVDSPPAPGTLEVGVSADGREVIVNHPDLKPDAAGVGHIVFSPEQARALARLLLAKADDCERVVRG